MGEIEMNKTLKEIRDAEYADLQERRRQEKEELQRDLEDSLNEESIEVLSFREFDNSIDVELSFTLDGFAQRKTFYWFETESKEEFLNQIKKSINYIKELRETYPEYCKQNDFIQTNRDYRKEFNLTHMGYKKRFILEVMLADFLELPNTTDTGFGGGDFEIKRTPKRVTEYNENIDIVIDGLLDCIAELKQKKYAG